MSIFKPNEGIQNIGASTVLGGTTCFTSTTEASGEALDYSGRLDYVPLCDCDVSGSVYADFVGADPSGNGEQGLVPAPMSGEETYFLQGDGTWAPIPGLSDGDNGDILVSGGGATWTIDGNAVDNTKLADMPTNTIKGRVTAGTGDPENLTTTQATTLINTFTDVLKGSVPASGGGTTNFLRADGTWTTVPCCLPDQYELSALPDPSGFAVGDPIWVLDSPDGDPAIAYSDGLVWRLADGEIIDDPAIAGMWFWVNGFSTDGLKVQDDFRNGTVRPLQPGRCVDLNGSTQYIDCPLATSITAYPLTIFARIKDPAGNTSLVMPLSLLTRAAGDRYLTLSSFDGRTPGTNRRNTTDTQSAFGSDWTNAWDTVAICWLSATSYKWSQNGSAWVTVSGLTSVACPTIDTLIIGQLRLTVPTAYFGGHLSDVRLWSDELSQAELDTVEAFGSHTDNLVGHWKLDDVSSTLFQDSSGNGNHGTAVGWLTTMHYEGKDVPYSWQNEVGYSSDNKTNIIIGGTDLSNGAWANIRSSESVNQDYSPVTGTLTADKLIEDGTAAASHFIYNSTAKAATALPYCCELYAKAAGRSEIRVLLSRANSANYAGAFFLLTGSGSAHTLITSGFSGIFAEILHVGDGWYRCRIGSVSDTDTWITVSIYTSAGGAVTSYNGDGVSGVLISDVRLFNGSFYTARKESAPTTDNLGNALQYTGQCPLELPMNSSNCLTLNGTNQYADCGTDTWDTDGTQAMVLRARIKFTSLVGNPVFLSYINAAGTIGWYAQVSDTGRVFFYLVNNGATNGLSIYTAAGTITTGVWYEFELTYDGSRTAAGVTLQLDGIPVPILTNYQTLTLSTSVSTVSFVGAASWFGSYVSGSICDITITIGSKTWEYWCAEGSGATIYNRNSNVTAGTGHGTIANPGSNWGTLQNVFHGNMLYGFRDSGGVKIPARDNYVAADGNALTNPAALPGAKDFHNGAETIIDWEAGEPDATIWATYNVPSAYSFGGALEDLQNRNYSAVRKDRFILRS